MLFAIFANASVFLVSGHVNGSLISGMPTILQLLSFRISDLVSFTILSSAAVEKEKW